MSTNTVPWVQQYLSLQATATTLSPGSSPYGSSVRGNRQAEVLTGSPKHPPELSPHASASSDLEVFSDDTPHESCWSFWGRREGGLHHESCKGSPWNFNSFAQHFAQNGVELALFLISPVSPLRAIVWTFLRGGDVCVVETATCGARTLRCCYFPAQCAHAGLTARFLFPPANRPFVTLERRPAAAAAAFSLRIAAAELVEVLRLRGSKKKRIPSNQ